MFRPAGFKVCNCCGGKAWPRKRVCDTCKVPAIWRAPTEAEAGAERDKRAEAEAAFNALLEGRL